LRELRLDLENELYEFWKKLPEPKICYTEWFYGDGGFWDLLNNRHLKKDSKAQEEKIPASEARTDLERMAFDILTAGSRR
jgi:hypothetical protein